jgi:hypothetical protein
MTSEARNVSSEVEARELLAAEEEKLGNATIAHEIRFSSDWQRYVTSSSFAAIQAALALRDEAYRAGGEAMRKLAVGAVQAARNGEADGDYRSISHVIECLALPPAQSEGEK